MTLDPATAAEAELRLLGEQLTRMRGMLYGYSELFFRRILAWAVITLALLVLGSTELAPAAGAAVPFLVPFAFLETGYLFFYTVFARRHAEALERTISTRLGRDILVAHRLEAAYFYPPDAPKVAGFSVGNPAGYVSAMTLGYTAGAAILWAVGLHQLAGWTADAAVGADGIGRLVLGLALPGVLAWTAAIAAYLLWTFLRRPDERRLLAELERAYPR